MPKLKMYNILYMS